MLVSNTEVRSYQGCQRAHYWSFGESVVPNKSSSKALTRGIIAHESLEAYYRAKQVGKAKEECMEAAFIPLFSAISRYPEYEKEITELFTLIERYSEHYWDEPWEILEIEKQYEHEMSPGVSFAMRLDLLVKDTDTGAIVLVDHKTLYDFFRPNEVNMQVQMMKYVKCLRENGINVTRAVLNQLRYRELKNYTPAATFKRTEVPLIKKKVDNIWEEHHKVAKQIVDLRNLPLTEHKASTIMSLDTKKCGMCSYRILCDLDLQGYRASNSLTLRDNFKANPYGYDKEDNGPEN